MGLVIYLNWKPIAVFIMGAGQLSFCRNFYFAEFNLYPKVRRTTGVFSTEKPKPRFPNGLAHCDPSLSDTDQNFVPKDR